MLNEETRRKLRLLNIGPMIEAADLQEQDPQILTLDFDERLAMLVDSLYQQKYNEKVQRLIKTARLRLPKADVHNIFYHPDRRLNRNLINGMATGQYIEDAKSVIIQGYSSSGKTYIACALAKEACRGLHRTRYIRVPDLLMEYEEKACEPGGKEKILKKYESFKVLVLDEWLTRDLALSDVQFFFELFERRFDSKTTIFCTLYRQEDWLPRLGNGVYAESIAERFVHNSIRLETGSMNMRAFYAKEDNLR